MVFEVSGVDEAADGVVREVPESQGDTSEMLKGSVDGLGGAVGGVGVVKVGQDVGGSLGQGPGQCLDLLQTVGDSLFQELMPLFIRCFPRLGSSAR